MRISDAQGPTRSTRRCVGTAWAQETLWYSTAVVPLALILFFAVVSVLGLVASLLPGVEPGLRWFRIAPRLALLVGLVVVVDYLLNADAEGYSRHVPLSALWSTLPIASMALTIVLTACTVGGYRAGSRSRATQLLYILLTASARAYLAFLLYWNLLVPPV